ncbi:MAG TPA: hypothetical protein VK789_28390 [Bryobacteraceae bacterium]|jgi:hypothetical protein|nr:hypothetical protein [Bryobacteraceae bacterium]
MSASVIEFPSAEAEVKPRLAVLTIEHAEYVSHGRHFRHCPDCHAAVPLHLAGCPVERRYMEAQARQETALVTCSFCEGEGFLASTTPGCVIGCPECQGRGRV